MDIFLENFLSVILIFIFLQLAFFIYKENVIVYLSACSFKEE